MSQWRDLFAAARIRVAQKEPYFTEVLMRLRVVESPGLGTLGVDGVGRLYVDPEAVVAWGSAGTAAVLAHEVQHVIRDHHGRIGDTRNPMIWNVAADCEINDDVKAAGWELPTSAPDATGTPIKMCMPGLFGLKDGDLAEEYYAKLIKQAKKIGVSAPKDGKGKGFHAPGTTHGKCGSCAGTPNEGEGQGDLPEGIGPHERETLKRRTADKIKDHQKNHGIGSVPAGLRAWADRILEPPKVDWRRQLRALVRRCIAASQGKTHRTWARLSGRYWAQRHVYGDRAVPSPSYYSPVPKVYVRLDISGSMFSPMPDGRTYLEAGLSEVAGVLKAAGVPLEAEAVDCDVHARQKIKGIASIQQLAVGGGGTDMRVGLQDALLKLRPDIFILMTDGFIPAWPSAHELRGVHTVICLIGPEAPTDLPAHLRNVVRVED